MQIPNLVYHDLCFYCSGAGTIKAYDPECGHDDAPCLHCMGSGLDDHGLIMAGLIQPPKEVTAWVMS